MKRILTLTLVSCLLLPSLAQESFDPLSMDVISDSHVTAFAMDEDGYMWIGTRRGLNRYNGSVFRKFYATGDADAITNDKITALCSDTDGRLWVGTEGGIHLFRDRKAELIPHGSPYSPSCIISYNDSILLASCAEGLVVYNKDSGSTRIVSGEASLSSSPQIACGSDGSVWVAGGKDCSVAVLDSSLAIISRIPLQGNAISGLCLTVGGDIAVSTDKGLFLIDGMSRKQKSLPKSLASLCSRKNVLFVANDPKYSRTVVGVANEGIYSLSLTKGEATRIWKDESLGDCSRCVFLVCPDNMWLSKNGRDFSMRTRNRAMEYHSVEGKGKIVQVHPLEDGTMLVVTDSQVLLAGAFGDNMTDVTPPGLMGMTVIRSLLSDGVLWLLTQEALLAYRPGSLTLNSIASFPCEGGKQLMSIAPGAVVLMMDEGQLVCTSEAGSSFIPVKDMSKFTGVSPTSDGEQYLFTQDAVYLMHANLSIELMVDNIPAPICACKDSYGKLWVGTQNNGVLIYDPDFKRIGTTDITGRLPDKTIRGIVMDREELVWVVTRTGISCISPGTGKSSVINGRGTFPSEFIKDGVALHPDGKITFVGVDGFVTINHPGADWPHEVKMEFDGLVTDRRVLGNPPEHLVLSHGESSPVFYISASDRQFNSSPQYEYMLKGRDRKWCYAGSYRRIAYSSLPGGKYTFMARISTNDGSLTSDTLSYSFRVKPSPWLSQSAIIGYFLVLCTSILVLHRGVRERRRVREQLEKATLEKALMDRIGKEKADFFTNVSHEFRTSLSLIYSPSKELREMGDRLPPRARELAEAIDRNAERMILLVNQLLAFNRAGSHENKLAVTKINLSQRLDSLVSDFSYLFENRHIALSREIRGNVSGWCDGEKFERIVFNLISNAAKYTPEGGSVCVRLLRDKDNAVVEVADTGLGVSDTDKEKIFGRFERVGDESMAMGFGIGLNFARQLAHMHKGEIIVMDNEPQGSVFRFSFPLAIEAYDDAEIWSDNGEEERSVEPDEPAAVRKKSKLVLVVEDNNDMRHYIAGILREDYDVVTAANGVKALQRMEATVPDLVVSDVMMPEMDGIELLSRLKNSEDYCHIPVVMLTAKADIDSRLQAVNSGADAYLPKPFEKRYLQAVVKNIFGNLARLQSKLAGLSSSEAVPYEPALSPKDKVFVDRLYAYLEQHMGDNGLSVNDLCSAVGISRTSVWSKVQTLFGMSPQTLILNYRMNKAMELLKAGEMNVSEVGYAVGFSSPSTFSRAFRAKFGTPPSSVLNGTQ